MCDRTSYILSETPLKKDLLRLFKREDRLIIVDIGGCEGEESIRYSKLFPNAEIFIFEPLPSNQDLIKQNFTNYKIDNVKLLPVALSDNDGFADFHVSSGHPEDQQTELDWNFGNKSSSLLEPETSTIHKWLKFKDKIKVPTMTLSTFVGQNKIDKIDFVHMDVQGAELKVLLGAKDNLKKIKAIWLEVSDITIYKNQVLRKEIEGFMKENGFFLVKTEMEGVAGDQFYINNKERSLLSFFNNLKNIKMRLSLKNIFRNKESLLINQHKKTSYSQSGEDLIVKFIFDCIGISKPTYLDIGAHHPYYISNTALFYENGSVGINVEPDPLLFNDFLIYRKNDVNLNIGVSDKNSELDFYVISTSTLNTFSKEEAEKYAQEGDYNITRTEKIKVKTLNYILDKYANSIFPQFLSIDAEGVDELIIKAINFEKNYPIVICIETITFSTSGNGIKNKSLISFIESKGYMVYADTNINTIFVKENFWKKK
jgi:FkbM family methyltransferase